ncbi:phosphotransferase [Humidisolicoccus flavus]|uniref:phosphotransferase n=1 Tax=Humidisolicoccus flavus TaxID=3111414 RepID=UPI00324B4CE1
MLDNASAVLTRIALDRGRTLESYRQKDIEPVSAGFIVGYSCTFARDGEREHVTVYINTSADAPRDEHTIELQDERTGNRLTAWVYPQDPSLPSLPAVSFPEAAGVVLSKFGIPADGASLTMEAYRPGKRAVLRIDVDGTQYFAKVVQPSLAQTIFTLHERFIAAGVRVPKCLGYSEQGLLLLERLEGDPASDHIASIVGDDRFLRSLTAFMGEFSRVRVHVGARESLARTAQWYSERMAETAPVFARSAAQIVERIGVMYNSRETPTPVTVHGDLHLGQIFVNPQQPTEVVGILDIDTAGLGDLADDQAALYAHVVISGLDRGALGDPLGAEQCAQLARTLAESWHGDARVEAIAATHLVGHALAVAGREELHSGSIAGTLLAQARAHVQLPPE